MNIKNVLKSSVLGICALVLVGLAVACQPDVVSEGNGLATLPMDSSFTITPVAGSANKFLLETSNIANISSNFWDILDEKGEIVSSKGGSNANTIFLPDAGIYTIVHRVSGIGGNGNSSNKPLVVATSDVNSGNLIKGGKFKTTEDVANWTVLNISNSGANVAFNTGSATFTATSYNQKGIYQAIQVQADKVYTFDMTVSGSGSKNTWFEVYVDPTLPVQGTEYKFGGRLLGLSTWDGCATTSFKNQLKDYACVGSLKGKAEISFKQSGIVYFLIKCGGEDNSAGITVTNIEFRGK